MVGPWSRIILRYGSGVLVGWGLLTPDTATALQMDPDVAAVMGFAISMAVEGYYWAAKRYGWST